jgi:HSP20 family protein
MALPERQRRWDPFAGLDDLQHEISRLLTSAFPDVSRIRINAWSPPVDVQETEEAFIIEADVPGVKPDELRVEAQGHEVRISGDVEETEREGVVHRGGRSRGHFDYRVTLPGDMNTETCEASLDQGVLRLRLPKTAAASRRRIPVRAAATPEIVSGEGRAMMSTSSKQSNDASSKGQQAGR